MYLLIKELQSILKLFRCFNLLLKHHGHFFENVFYLLNDVGELISYHIGCDLVAERINYNRGFELNIFKHELNFYDDIMIFLKQFYQIYNEKFLIYI